VTVPLPSLPYQLTVDSGSRDEPSVHRFKSLTAVWRAHDALDAQLLPFAEVRLASLNGRGGVYWPLIDRQGRVVVYRGRTSSKAVKAKIDEHLRGLPRD